MIIIFFLSLLIHLRTEFSYEYTNHIEGIVTKCTSNYDYIRTKHGTIKLYNDCDFEFNDYVDIYIEYMDINTNSNDYAFNEELYLKGQNIFLKAKLKSINEVKHRRNLYHFIDERLSKLDVVKGYQRLLIFGEKDIHVEEEYKTLSDLSLVHLFALSGMHVSILYSLLSQIIGMFIPKKYAKYMCFICIGVYVFSIPFSISLLRAFFTMLLYELFKNHINKLDVLGILIIVSLFYNPYYIYNISFVFSYFIYFVVLLTNKIKNSFFYIYLSTIPIVLSINYEFSILSILSADALKPFIEVFYVLNCLSVLFPFLEVVLLPCVSCLNSIVLFLEHISFRFLVGKPNLTFMIFYYTIFFIILKKKAQNKNVFTEICVLISLILSFSFYSRYKIYGQVTMIDVGQGDCTLIRLPLNRGNILIDTGGNKDYDLATNTIIPYLKASGIDHIDYVYISHDDYDHIGALESLLNNYKINTVIDYYEEYRKIDMMKVEMISHRYSNSENDNSLIMRITLPPMTLLFMGDASTTLEKEICEKDLELSADIIKIGHHGSSSSTSSLLLDTVKPSIAMIGVKKNNIYNHPSCEVISRLERKGIHILRTDIDGMFHIRFYDDKKYYIYD